MIHKAQTAQQLVEQAHIASPLGVVREVHATRVQQEREFRELIKEREALLLDLKVQIAGADLLNDPIDGLGRVILKQVAVKEWLKLSRIRYEQVQHEAWVLGDEVKRQAKLAARSSAAIAKYSRPGARGPQPPQDYGMEYEQRSAAGQHALEGEAIRKRRFEQAVIGLAQLVGDPSNLNVTAILKQQELDAAAALRKHDATHTERRIDGGSIWPEKRTGGTAPPDSYPGDGD